MRRDADIQHLWRQSVSAAGHRLWNSLPSHLKEADLSYSRFRRSPTTFLFELWGHGAIRTILIAPFRNNLTDLLGPTYHEITRGLTNR